jgi:hypothetical protein
MNTSTSSRRGRYAAAIATTALVLGAAACGTETGPDNGERAAAAVAPDAKVQTAPHPPMSADQAERLGVASERWAAQQLQDQYLSHLESAAEQGNHLKLRRQSMRTPSGREMPIP